MCQADITPVSWKRAPSYGPGTLRYQTDFGAAHQCRDYGRIYDWAMERKIDQFRDKELLYYKE